MLFWDIEAELRILAVNTVSGDLAAVQSYDASYKIQSQSQSLLVLASGFIRFIELVKYKGYLCFLDTCTAVFYQKIGTGIIFGYVKFDITAVIREFDSVFDKVINYLMDKILIAADLFRGKLIQSPYLDILLVDLLLKAYQDCDKSVESRSKVL